MIVARASRAAAGERIAGRHGGVWWVAAGALLAGAGVMAAVLWAGVIADRDGAPGDAASMIIIDRTNEERARYGLAPLVTEPVLTRAAAAYARELARDGRLDHAGAGGSTVDSRAEAQGYSGWTVVAENLAEGAGAPDAAAVVEAWMRSAGHRRNMLSGALTEVGVACEPAQGGYLCVAEFGVRD